MASADEKRAENRPKNTKMGLRGEFLARSGSKSVKTSLKEREMTKKKEEGVKNVVFGLKNG